MGGCCQARKPAWTQLLRDAIRAIAGRAEVTGDIEQSRMGERSGWDYSEDRPFLRSMRHRQTESYTLRRVVLGQASTLLARISNDAYMQHCEAWNRMEKMRATHSSHVTVSVI